jgi:hypothetical protein
VNEPCDKPFRGAANPALTTAGLQEFDRSKTSLLTKQGETVPRFGWWMELCENFFYQSTVYFAYFFQSL